MSAEDRPGQQSADIIDAQYRDANPRSREAFERQHRVVAGGYSHLARQLAPFPLFIRENRGARKHDIDGHEYIDYWMGHGAMLLGHAHPAVTQAIADQAGRGTHAGGETELAIEWATLIQQSVPSAERVRFVASGGEATQLAMRLARAYTGKQVVIKFESSMHGWHDAAAVGGPPHGATRPPGVPDAVGDTLLLLPFNDLGAAERTLSARADVAAVIMEPGGPHSDTVPSDPSFLRGVRELTARRDVLLIFDEVVTGFRYSIGGAQEFFGVTPDLTALGKIIGGGLPCGALAGRADVMELFEWRTDQHWVRSRMIPHSGTWNAAPVTAAAGIAALRLVRESGAADRARGLAQRLIGSVNTLFRDLDVQAFAYGRSSIVRLCPGEPPPLVREDFSAAQADGRQLAAGWGQAGPMLRKAMILEGVDLMGTQGFLSAAHTEDDVDATCEAVGRAVARMRKAGWL
jgi:glutamate-1-semialdehyde 2,1-aminomutase